MAFHGSGGLLLMVVVSASMAVDLVGEETVFEEQSLGLTLSSHARTRRHPAGSAPPRDRNPIVYFYSRGGRQVTNRGAEVFHQLHDAVTLHPTSGERDVCVCVCERERGWGRGGSL